MKSEHSGPTTSDVYRTVAFASVTIALIGLLGGAATGYFLTGALVFVAGMWIAVGVALFEWRSSQGDGTDGPHEVAFERASYWTVVTILVVTATLFPPVPLLAAGDWIGTVPGFRFILLTLSTLVLFFTSLYVIFRAKT